jgi:broad specificity phosphatase PhoE
MNTELSHIGYLQTQALGRHLQFHRFSHIFSSDLKRASEVSFQSRKKSETESFMETSKSLELRLFVLLEQRSSYQSFSRRYFFFLSRRTEIT